MVNINLLNSASLERELESIGRLELAEEIIEKMKEVVAYHEIAERIMVQVIAVVNGLQQKVYAMFNILENEDGETDEKNVEFEVIGYTNIGG
ncbi:hypothetical protein [Bacillus atrophaeus]|uniref:hypothetical protein n=1 Tax=Bacillus atrophaeus TaxID=1452 RepID=UPI000B4557D1|nr:hypothetical protein [Bacillus atrophaeus]ARW09088.1 uncharacterized protein S101359_04114 [Bacillus atrophaeus]